jgi:hypothetical protein
MRTTRLLLLAVVFIPSLAIGQDWQDYKPDGDFSFKEIKAAVRRVTTTHMYSGWDEKTFSRSGDLVAVAVLKTLDDSEMSTPEGAKDVLRILRAAFGCPDYCVKTTDDRHPRIALLLLTHLRAITRGKLKSEIDETEKFITQQARKLG